jgi:transposase
VEREFRSVPIGGKAVVIRLGVQRVLCLNCGVVRQVRLGFAEARRCYTRSFERYVLALSRRMTILDVSRHLGVSWDIVKEIQKRYLTRCFGRPRLKDVHYLAIDEIAVRKGHKYLTVVLDLNSGAVVFVGNGKGAESLLPFWRRLRRSGARVKAVAMDLSFAYTSAVMMHLPEAAIVYDRFHLIKLFNDVLSNLRREIQRQAQTHEGKQVVKGIRWLLLKRSGNLDETKNERQRLQTALELNAPLATGYYLKEDLGQLWEQPDKELASRFLDGWLARAFTAHIPLITTFARTLKRHRQGILAYYDYPITTGPLEGVNNKIKTLKRQAYGFRNLEFFKLRILGLHETKYALVG